MSNFLKISGDYKDWDVYRKSVIICDVTEMFINRALPQGSRTIDQMRQAARSCKQNIVEGTRDSTVSAEICIKLMGIARGSIAELLEDYGDYLRQHKYETWSREDPRTSGARKFCMSHYDSLEFVEKCEIRSNETVANIMLTQCHQMDAMLAKVLKNLEQQFLEEGGIKENMNKARRQRRGY